MLYRLSIYIEVEVDSVFSFRQKEKNILEREKSSKSLSFVNSWEEIPDKINIYAKVKENGEGFLFIYLFF